MNDRLKLVSTDVQDEPGVVRARQRARQIAQLLGFENQDQVRIATAVSEIARNAFQYGRGGRVDFRVLLSSPQALEIVVRDSGPGIRNLDEILGGLYRSPTGMGIGMQGASRLMDSFEVDSSPTGAVVTMVKSLPPRAVSWTPATVGKLAADLAQEVEQDPYHELQKQNREMLSALGELQERQAELVQINRELDDTNRGVVALHAELDERADDLRRASDLKTRFLSNMTHEFRTPLNSILSLTHMLLTHQDGELNEEQEKQLGFIRRSAESLSELVNDLLDLAKVEAGKLTVRCTRIEIGEMFNSLRGILRPLLAPTSPVRLVFEEPGNLDPMMSDESKIAQILRNFVSNGLKFTEKGEVRVSVREEEGDRVTFSVTDTGIGISPQDQERIFEEFVQVEGAQQQKFRGTGLGLSLSKRLAQLLGGSVSLTSEMGVGSTFRLTVPRIFEESSEEGFMPVTHEKVDPLRFPVLVVEDNREVLYVYERFLRGTAFQMIPARSLREARQRLAEVRPVAVVLDILLDGANAWPLLERLKADPVMREIPVYVVTIMDNRDKAVALGADDFQMKPMDRDWLLARLTASVAARPREEVLIIDDDEVARYIVCGALGATRFECIQAAGGLDGVERAQTSSPAVILLDLAMPDMDGWTVLDKLRGMSHLSATPIFIYTSQVLSESQQEVLLRRAQAILAKSQTDPRLFLEDFRQAIQIHRRQG